MSEDATVPTVLNDSEIEAQIKSGLMSSGFTAPADPFTKDSPIQPASLDLTVGLVFRPCTEEENKQDLPGGQEEYILEPGRTAIVLTREELKMPADLIAIGFPPSKQASVKGILMTNPGQVDPGYHGKLRFTVINMGRKDFVLRQGDVIVSLILMKLEKPAYKDWITRHSQQKGGPITWENLNRVSSDFLNVEARASKIAEDAVNKADAKIKKLQIWVPVCAGILTLVLTGLISFLSSLWQPSWKDPLQKAQQDIAVLQSEKDVTQIKKQIQDLEVQIKALQQKVPAALPPSKH